MGKEWNDPWEEWEGTPALKEDEIDRTISPRERFVDILISIALLVLSATLLGLVLVVASISLSAIPFWVAVIAPIFLLILVPITNSIYNKIRNM